MFKYESQLKIEQKKNMSCLTLLKILLTISAEAKVGYRNNNCVLKANNFHVLVFSNNF